MNLTVTGKTAFTCLLWVRAPNDKQISLSAMYGPVTELYRNIYCRVVFLRVLLPLVLGEHD